MNRGASALERPQQDTTACDTLLPQVASALRWRQSARSRRPAIARNDVCQADYQSVIEITMKESSRTFVLRQRHNKGEPLIDSPGLKLLRFCGADQIVLEHADFDASAGALLRWLRQSRHRAVSHAQHVNAIHGNLVRKHKVAND